LKPRRNKNRNWAALSGVSKPVGQQCCIQKAWDGPVSANQVIRMLSSTSNDMHKSNDMHNIIWRSRLGGLQW